MTDMTRSPDLHQRLIGIALVATFHFGCDGDDPDPADTSSNVTATGTTQTSATGNAESGETGNAQTGGGSTAADTTGSNATGSETGEGIDCGEATDAATCAAAMNHGEGGECNWLEIQSLTIDDAGGCGFATTGEGLCVAASGLDDGCSLGFVCDDGREVYYRAADGGGWQMTQGTACGGISGFMNCEDTDVEPCNCACELP